MRVLGLVAAAMFAGFVTHSAEAGRVRCCKPLVVVPKKVVKPALPKPCPHLMRRGWWHESEMQKRRTQC